MGRYSFETNICCINRTALELILLIVLIITYPSISFSNANMIFERNNSAVVIVMGYDEIGNLISQGSGFIVRSDGRVITNYHVISNAKDIKVKVGSKILPVEGIVHIDKESDIVILKAEGKNYPTVKLGDAQKAKVGEKVYVISSPMGFENTISEGILSGIRELSSDITLLQITAPISQGSSGGPVFNKDGEVIGVATFLIKESQNLNFALSINRIKDKISEKVISLREAEFLDFKKTAEYWFILGYLSANAGMYREAIEAFKKAIMIKPDYAAEAYYNLGISYAHLGMYREAIEACKKAIRIKPDYAEAYYNLGITHLILNDRGSALEIYKILKKIDPELANNLFNLIFK